MKNEPKVIYLNTGKQDHDIDFKSCQGVTWHDKKLFGSDIKFIHHGELVEFLKANPKSTAEQILKHLEELK